MLDEETENKILQQLIKQIREENYQIATKYEELLEADKEKVTKTTELLIAQKNFLNETDNTQRKSLEHSIKQANISNKNFRINSFIKVIQTILFIILVIVLITK